MVNKSKNIGTAAESAVVRYLLANGWPAAERRALAGSYDLGDIVGTPGVCWEVKGGHAAESASDGDIARWLKETETERQNSHSDVGVLVVKRPGHGHQRAGLWWAVMTLADVSLLARESCDVCPPSLLGFIGAETPIRMHLSTAVTLLRAAGYGDPLEQQESA